MCGFKATVRRAHDKPLERIPRLHSVRHHASLSSIFWILYDLGAISLLLKRLACCATRSDAIQEATSPRLLGHHHFVAVTVPLVLPRPDIFLCVAS